MATSSFYNIDDASRMNFTFDKIYHSYNAMLAGQTSDGIFINRYILIKYNDTNADAYYDSYDSTVWTKASDGQYKLVVKLNSNSGKTNYNFMTPKDSQTKAESKNTDLIDNSSQSITSILFPTTPIIDVQLDSDYTNAVNTIINNADGDADIALNTVSAVSADEVTSSWKDQYTKTFYIDLSNTLKSLLSIINTFQDNQEEQINDIQNQLDDIAAAENGLDTLQNLIDQANALSNLTTNLGPTWQKATNTVQSTYKKATAYWVGYPYYDINGNLVDSSKVTATNYGQYYWLVNPENVVTLTDLYATLTEQAKEITKLKKAINIYKSSYTTYKGYTIFPNSSDARSEFTFTIKDVFFSHLASLKIYTSSSNILFNSAYGSHGSTTEFEGTYNSSTGLYTFTVNVKLTEAQDLSNKVIYFESTYYRAQRDETQIVIE